MSTSVSKVDDSESRWLLYSGERLLDFRFCWIVFIHVVWGHLGGLLQFIKWEAVTIFLASVLSGIWAMDNGWKVWLPGCGTLETFVYIPAAIKVSLSLDSFKRHLKAHYFTSP